MSSWTNISSTVLEVGKPIRSIDITALKENIIALSEGAAGAPKVLTAAINDLAVTEAKLATGSVTNAKIGLGAIFTGNIAAGQVTQSRLLTTTGEVVQSGADGWFMLLLPGGEYGFYPQVKTGAGSNNTHYMAVAILPGGMDVAAPETAAFNETQIQTTYRSLICLWQQSGGADTNRAQQRYIQASPPYDHGDGEVRLYVFLVVNSAGKIIGAYIAEDPPWANNGPTNTRADFYDEQGRAWQIRQPRPNLALLNNPATRDAELGRIAEPQTIEVTQELKHADMPLIPHPFGGNDLTNQTVILLDPISPMMNQLKNLMRSGESVSEILCPSDHSNRPSYINFGNTDLGRKGPPGVMSVAASWRNS